MVQRRAASAAGASWRAAQALWQRCCERVRRTRASWLEARLAALAPHGPALRQHADAVEQAFVTVGAALAEQRRLAAELLRQGTQLASLTAVSADENPVRAAAALAAQAVAELDAFQGDTARLVESLQSQHAAIAAVRKGGEQLERAIAPLRIVDTLFRIEAAGLPAETRAAFSALTHDIAELDTKVRETFLRHFEALGAARESIGQVLAHFAAQSAAQERAAGVQRAAVREALQTIERDIAQLRTGTEDTAARTRCIDRDAGGMVVALQFQDITRQKLEHVISAIESLPRRVGGRPAATAAAVAEQAARLEAMQLQAIDADLAQAVAAVEDGLGKIVASVQAVEQNCRIEAGGGQTAVRVDAMFEHLEGMLESLRGPMQAAAKNAEAAAAAVRAFGGLTADLGATTRELTWGIRLIALNAQVQAAQVQRCDGLEVLARHTYVVSEETSRCADVIGRDLAVVAGRLVEIAGAAEAFAAKTAAAEQRLDTEGSRLRPALRAQRGAAAEALRRVPMLARETHAFAAELIEDAVLARVDRAPLALALAELTALAAEAGPRASAAARAVAKGEAAAARTAYTMASEREIHAAALDGAAAAEAAPTPQPAASESAPYGGNVELF